VVSASAQTPAAWRALVSHQCVAGHCVTCPKHLERQLVVCGSLGRNCDLLRAGRPWALKRDRTVTLTEHGIIIDEKETTYDEWRRAWFQQRGGLFELHLEKKAGLQRRENLPLAIGVHPEAIAEILADRVPFEINHRETFLDSITHILKI